MLVFVKKLYMERNLKTYEIYSVFVYEVNSSHELHSDCTHIILECEFEKNN